MSCSGHFYGDKRKMSSSAVLWHNVVFADNKAGNRLYQAFVTATKDVINPTADCLPNLKNTPVFFFFFLFCLGGKHLKTFPSTSEKEKIMSIKKVSTGTNDKGTDNCFPAQVSF